MQCYSETLLKIRLIFFWGEGNKGGKGEGVLFHSNSHIPFRQIPKNSIFQDFNKTAILGTKAATYHP